MTEGERMVELLRATAADLDEGVAPLGHPFLVEHAVTLDEAHDLAEMVSTSVRVLLELSGSKEGKRMIIDLLAQQLMRTII